MYYIQRLNRVPPKTLFYSLLILLVMPVLVMMSISREQKVNYSAELKVIEDKISQLDRLISKPPVMSTLLQNLEMFSGQNGIQIKSIKQYQNRIYLIVQSNKASLMKFLHYCESFSHYSKFEYLKIAHIDSHVTAEIKLSFLKYYHIKKNRLLSKRDGTLQLKAIVGNHVIINDKLLTINELIDELRVIKIGQNFVVLEDKNQHHVLRLYHDIK